MMFLAYVLSIAFLACLIWLFHKQNDSVIKHLYWPVLGYRLGAGLCVALLYSFYYTEGDTFSFFRDAVRLAEAARNNPAGYIRFLWNGGEDHALWRVVENHQSRSLFMVKWVSIVSLVSADNYWIATLYFSFFSFAGAWYLAGVIAGKWERAWLPALIAFLIYPSIALWSSGIMKESLALPCLFCMTALFLKFRISKRLSLLQWFVLLLTVWIGWRLKYYYTGIFVAVVAASLATTYAQKRLEFHSVRSQVICWIVTFILFIAAATLLHPNFNLGVIPQVITENYHAFAEKSDAGGMIVYPDLNPTWPSMITYAPKALVSGIFRPFPWEADSWVMVAGALESAVLLIFFLWATVRYLRAPTVKEPILMLALATYVILLGVLLPLSTPNFGTLSRYRIGYLSFFVFVIMLGNPLMKAVPNLFKRKHVNT